MKLCRDCGVEKNREELLHWFNDLGVSFCYSGSAKLEDYVILKPEWLTNAIYILLFNECPEAKNGILPRRAIDRMLCPPEEERDQIRRVLNNVDYGPNETDYVMDVVRKFHLSYRLRDDAEFIPVLCQRESTDAAQEYAQDPDALEFRMTYEYLPENVIHRLMVELRQDLDLQNVWRTGARFVQPGTGLSAVVMGEGNILNIYVRSENTMHRSNTYLSSLKGNIDRINEDLHLALPFCEVIYKADGMTEAFDYEDLLLAIAEGETEYRSKLRNRPRRYIPIEQILNRSARTAERELDKLRMDLINACLQLQGNRIFWNASEDERNTFLRDSLRTRGYIVHDQTLQGVSSGGKRAGELDLEIRQEPNIPWTLCEAMRIRDRSKGIWNDHLLKLLDNYNPGGLDKVFLVTYVDCGKDAFSDIWSDFYEHIRWHDPGEYRRAPNHMGRVDMGPYKRNPYIRAPNCTYDRNGAPITVCHIFVRIGA